MIHLSQIRIKFRMKITNTKCNKCKKWWKRWNPWAWKKCKPLRKNNRLLRIRKVKIMLMNIWDSRLVWEIAWFQAVQSLIIIFQIQIVTVELLDYHVSYGNLLTKNNFQLISKTKSIKWLKRRADKAQVQWDSQSKRLMMSMNKN